MPRLCHARCVVALVLLFVFGCTADDTGGALDAGPDQADAARASDCQFDDSVVWDPLGEIQQMESDDRSSCVWLSRRNDCPAGTICKAVPFTLLEIRIGHAGEVVEQDDLDALHWESTHHNWADSGEVEIDGTRYDLEYIYSPESGDSSYELSATNIGNEELLWGPLALHPVNKP